MRDKPRRQPTVWIGECVCGLIVYETADGKRFEQKQNRPHSNAYCKARRDQSKVVPFPEAQ
jgi:hypothetical protein